MGWGITKREPPDKRIKEMTNEEKQNKIVKRVKSQDQMRKKKLRVAALMFDGDGKCRQEERSRHELEERTGADKGKQAVQQVTGQGSGKRSHMNVESGPRSSGSGRGAQRELTEKPLGSLAAPRREEEVGSQRLGPRSSGSGRGAQGELTEKPLGSIVPPSSCRDRGHQVLAAVRVGQAKGPGVAQPPPDSNV